MSLFSKAHALGHAAHLFTGKAAFESLNSHTGSYAGQTVCTGHPYRVHGIFPPFPGLVFQFWAGAEAPQLPREMGKGKGQVLESSLPLTSFSFPGLDPLTCQSSSQILPLCCPFLWWGGGERAEVEVKKELRWPWG